MRFEGKKKVLLKKLEGDLVYNISDENETIPVHPNFGH